MAKKLPSRIYVKREKSDSDDTEWFNADEDFEALGELGEVVEIGYYQLIDTKQLDGKPRFLK